jgi:hypothetical protein
MEQPLAESPFDEESGLLRDPAGGDVPDLALSLDDFHVQHGIKGSLQHCWWTQVEICRL